MYNKKTPQSYEVLQLKGVYLPILWHIGLYIPTYESILYKHKHLDV